MLTVADIRAVGPKVWNGWKGQLLRNLFHNAEALMSSGDLAEHRRRGVERARSALKQALTEQELAWQTDAFDDYFERHDPRYWLGSSLEQQIWHAEMVQTADQAGENFALAFRVDPFRARTEMALYAQDHAGLFMKVTGALAASGVHIADAHIFTTQDGMAIDSFGLQDTRAKSGW